MHPNKKYFSYLFKQLICHLTHLTEDHQPTKFGTPDVISTNQHPNQPQDDFYFVVNCLNALAKRIQKSLLES